MGLIKSADAPVTLRAFSMRDIEAQARQILLRGRQQAEELIAAARQEALDIRKRAEQDGFAEGRRKGLEQGSAEGRTAGHAQALAENQEALRSLISSLAQAAAQIDADRSQLETQAIGEVVQLAGAIARRVTKRQGMMDEQVLCENVREAMGLVVHAADVRIALHPSQLKTLQDELPALKMDWPQLNHVELAPDETIAPGGARIHTAHGLVDADLDAQLDRVIGHLLPEGGVERR